MSERQVYSETLAMRRAPTPSGWLAFRHAIAWGLPVVALMFVVPRYQAIFFERGADLPGLTVAVFRAAHLVDEMLPVVVLFLACLLLADWILLGRLAASGERRWRRAWSAAMFAVPIAGLALIVLAILMPFLAVSRDLAG